MVFTGFRLSSTKPSVSLTREEQGGQVRYTQCALTGEGEYIVEVRRKGTQNDYCQVMTLTSSKPCRRMDLLADDLDVRVRTAGNKTTKSSPTKNSKWTVDVTGFLEDPEPAHDGNVFHGLRTRNPETQVTGSNGDIVHLSSFAVYDDEFPLKDKHAYVFEIYKDDEWFTVGRISNISTVRADLYVMGDTKIRCRKVGGGAPRQAEWGFAGYIDEFPDDDMIDSDDIETTSEAEEAAYDEDSSSEDGEPEQSGPSDKAGTSEQPAEIEESSSSEDEAEEQTSAAEAKADDIEGPTAQDVEDSDSEDDDDDDDDEDDDDDDDAEDEKTLQARMSDVFKSTVKAGAEEEEDDDDEDEEDDDSNDSSEEEVEEQPKPVSPPASNKRKSPESGSAVVGSPVKKPAKESKETKQPTPGAGTVVKPAKSDSSSSSPEDEYVAAIVKFMKGLGGSAKLTQVGSKVKRPAKCKVGKLNAFLRSRKEFKLNQDTVTLA